VIVATRARAGGPAVRATEGEAEGATEGVAEGATEGAPDAAGFATFYSRSRRDCLSVDATVVGERCFGLVEVEVRRSQGCKGCAGLCMWRRLPDRGRERYRADCAFEVGEAVALRLPARSLLRGAVLLYGLPLAVLLAGGVAGQWWLGTDAGCLLGALAGVALILLAGPRFARRVERAAFEEVRVERR
jgi:positive regulator of sigma E activity